MTTIIDCGVGTLSCITDNLAVQQFIDALRQQVEERGTPIQELTNLLERNVSC